MANKKITELVQTTIVENNDLLLLETANGTRSISLETLRQYIGGNIELPFTNCAASHNGIFRGKNLTNIYTIDQIVSKISNGTFEDLYIGDYFDIVISTKYFQNEVVRCILAGFDTYWNNGSVDAFVTSTTSHHAVIVPKNCFKGRKKMNETDTTTGGLIGSEMWKTTIPVYGNALKLALNNHIIFHNGTLTNNINTDLDSNAGAGFKGASSNNVMTNMYISLLSEIQVYGSNVVSSSFYDTGCDNLQLPLFSLDPTAKVCGFNNNVDGEGDNNRCPYWLKNISSASRFAGVDNYGGAETLEASQQYGLRPVFCIG